MVVPAAAEPSRWRRQLALPAFVALALRGAATAPGGGSVSESDGSGGRDEHAALPADPRGPQAAGAGRGEPNAAHVMRYLRSHGIGEIAINVHYLADAIRDGVRRRVGATAYGLHYLDEPSARKRRSRQADGVVLRRYVRRRRLRRSHRRAARRTDRAFTERAARSRRSGWSNADDVTQYGVVVLDDTGKIVEFPGKAGARHRALAPRQHRHLRLRTGDSRAYPRRNVLRFRQGCVSRTAARADAVLRDAISTARIGATSGRRRNTAARPTTC